MTKILKDLIFNLLIAGLLFFNLSVWNFPVLNIVLFFLYFLANTGGSYLILKKFFFFSPTGLRTKILSAFAVFMMLGVFAGVGVIFYKITPLVISASFFINGMMFAWLKIWARRGSDASIEKDESTLAVLDELPSPIIWLVVFFGLVIYGFYLLVESRTGAVITSPWQTIDKNYLFVFLSATVICAILIFSNLKAKVLLFAIILLSLLQHSYLPVTHQLVYGADAWRHVATEESLMQGESLSSVTLSEEPLGFWRQIDLGKLSYGQFWSLEVILSKIFGTSALNVNIWFQPILWGILFPILLFEFGRVIGLNKKQSLFFSWLGLMPFAFQSAGSFTLPVNLGFLWWLLLIILILKRLNKARGGQMSILIGAGVALFFGYALYFLLYLIAFGIAFVLKEMESRKISIVRQRISAYILAFSLVFIIPLAELIAKYSFIDRTLSIFGQLKQMAGNFSGWYLASGPRTHDISTGNIILNQIPSYSFVANPLIASRWWLVIIIIIFLAFSVVGLYICFAKKKLIGNWLGIISSMVFGGYILSRYFLSGEQVLSRRLDVVFALFLLALAVLGAEHIYTKYLRDIKFNKLILVLGTIMLAIAGSAIYSMGPDTNTVSANEYTAMEAIWQREKGALKHCVISDTYPLLALEAISAKKIIGGGFPINEFFAQPERTALYGAIRNFADPQLFNSGHQVTGADKCFFVGPVDVDFHFNNYVENSFKNFVVFGNIIVWEN